MDEVSTTNEPPVFVNEPEFQRMFARMMVGAIIGVALGAVAYLSEQRLLDNVLASVNNVLSGDE